MAQTCGINPEELRVREGEYPANESPLETAWTFWYDKHTSDKKESDQYMEGLRQLGTFSTIQGFYRHYSYLRRPSELPRDYNCYMFRKNYKPMWEEFPEGGCWIIRIKRKAAQNYVNHMWENLLIACIGEAFEMPDVVGCVLSTKLKDDVLSIWNLSNRGTPARFRIGERLKEILDLNMTALIQYKEHMQSLQDYSTFRNARNYMFTPSPAVTPMQNLLQTPLRTHQDNVHDEFDQGMLPPAAIDTMLPPAAVDAEGLGGQGWGSADDGSPVKVAKGSPPLSAAAAPFAPAAVPSIASPQLSAEAAPFHPAGSQGGATRSGLDPPESAGPKSWAAVARAAGGKGDPSATPAKAAQGSAPKSAAAAPKSQTK